MTPFRHADGEQLPPDLEDVAQRLRSERERLEPLELDRVKTRVLAKSRSSQPRGLALKSRGIAAVLTLALMAAGTGGVIAGGTTGGSSGSASNSQYKPGCGPPPNGVNPSGTHTGAPGNPSACQNRNP